MKKSLATGGRLFQHVRIRGYFDAIKAMMGKETVAVGMSGGVDSSVAAHCLLEAGHAVVGLTMTIWDDRIPVSEPVRGGCFGPGEKEDVAAARESARRLGIPHHTVPLADEYRARVLDPFCAGYLRGITPNPCALCNPQMKFGALLRQARAQGIAFDRFATGHYAQIRPDDSGGRMRLFRGVDREKDQSYFLARLTQEQLATTLFPLGALRKDEVRRMAESAGLEHAAAQRESQDFFEGADRSVLFPEGTIEPGPILNEAGDVLGEHRGIAHYTIGQRSGLGVAARERLYVKEIRASANAIVLGPRESLLAAACGAERISWIAGAPPARAFRASVRLRYRHPGAAASVSLRDDATARIEFDEPQWAATPGQMAVFYDGDEALGGGWIVPPPASQGVRR